MAIDSRNINLSARLQAPSNSSTIHRESLSRIPRRRDRSRPERSGQPSQGRHHARKGHCEYRRPKRKTRSPEGWLGSASPQSIPGSSPTTSPDVLNMEHAGMKVNPCGVSIGVLFDRMKSECLVRLHSLLGWQIHDLSAGMIDLAQGSGPDVPTAGVTVAAGFGLTRSLPTSLTANFGQCRKRLFSAGVLQRAQKLLNAPDVTMPPP